MLYNYSISNLTGLQDLKIKNIDTLGNFLLINAEIERKPHKCPCCNDLTDKVHDYSVQVLPYRNTEYLIKYFKQWDLDKRKAVEYFVSDMWQPYTDLSTALFKNSRLIIDKYH